MYKPQLLTVDNFSENEDYKNLVSVWTLLLILFYSRFWLCSVFFQRNPREKVNVGIRQPYFRVVGIKVNTEGTGRTTQNIVSPAEEEDFRRLAASPNIYETLAKSVAPSIFGSIDIKKAITCLLFGGSRKR